MPRKPSPKYERAVREVRAEAEQVRKREAAAAREENATLVDAARSEAESHLESARTELAVGARAIAADPARRCPKPRR